MAPNLNRHKMYQLYEKECQDEGKQPLKEWVYYDVMHKEFDYLSFAELKSDTCNTCDAFKAKGEENSEEHLRHLSEAESVYESKREDKKKCETDKECLLISFDLQKCLPTPNLTCSEAFYKRLLWVYNLTIIDYTTGQSTCYMWSENIARRGSKEIASCLYHFITKRIAGGHFKSLILYSDSCAGQNKNKNVLAMEKYLLDQTILESVKHTYMVLCHTHMECDAIHGMIERAKKRCSVNLPEDWYNVVRMAKLNK